MCFVASVPVMETGPQNSTVLDGKDATISCRAVGAPTPNITWVYNGKTERPFIFPVVLLHTLYALET